MTTATPSTGRIQIREAERADLLAVYRIEQEAFPQPWPFTAFEQYLGDPGFLVADDRRITGYVVGDVVATHAAPMGHIKDLAVCEDRRGEGIGTLLLTSVLDVLAGQVDSVKLEVRENNETAIRLYETHGFEFLRRLPEYYSNGEDALVLVRTL